MRRERSNRALRLFYNGHLEQRDAQYDEAAQELQQQQVVEFFFDLVCHAYYLLMVADAFFQDVRDVFLQIFRYFFGYFRVVELLQLCFVLFFFLLSRKER